MKLLVIDNYDSFTYNLVHFLGELGADSKVWRNDKISLDEIADMAPEGIVLSPGPGTPQQAGICLALIDRFNAVVGRDTLVRRAWPGGSPTRNALDVHMLRLRRRISALGLEVRTVRARGYLLQALEPNGVG